MCGIERDFEEAPTSGKWSRENQTNFRPRYTSVLCPRCSTHETGGFKAGHPNQL